MAKEGIYLSRFSEPYAPTGGIAAQGVKNLLGRPNLEPLELLTREAIQNSWDAKREDHDTVEVTLSLFELDIQARKVLETMVLPAPPPNLPLADELNSESVSLLCIADRGTCGLRGDIRATAIQPGDNSDFVDFVRNIGEPPDREFGGGSFGYGKGAFYLLSHASTIIVHTHCTTKGGIESRLIACSLGDNYNDKGGDKTRRTGRHWWGVINDDVVDPVIGTDADGLAAALGMPPFEGDATGTTVAIVAPKIELPGKDGETTRQEEGAQEIAMKFIQESVLWNFWPKMITRGQRAPGIDFTFLLAGEEVGLVEPDEHPRLREFAGALRALDGLPTEPCLEKEVVSLSSKRPKKLLGGISLRRFSNQAAVSSSHLPAAAKQMELAVHHVALMRNAELVVKYMPGPAFPNNFVGYAGVFRCTEDLDQVFRQAEPPTHDKWEPRSLEGAERTYVNVALDRVRAQAENFATPITEMKASAADLPIGQFASELAGLIPTVGGLGAGVPAGRSSKSTGVIIQTTSTAGSEPAPARENADTPATPVTPSAGLAPPIVEIVEIAHPVFDEGGIPVLTTSFKVRAGASEGTSVVITGIAGVLTLDGAALEVEPPEGAVIPKVLRWISPTGEEHDAGESRLIVDISELSKPWVMHTTLLPDAAVRVEIGAEWVQ